MAKVNFTAALKRFYPTLEPMVVEGNSVAEILAVLEKKHTGLTDYLVDEHGELRQHINIFIGDQMLTDRTNLSDEVRERDEVLIFQALSGG
ncbi:MAG: MoaD/ThiS family protein [Saprospiraceae bacterium]|nr:MoaD/ThiS family protein [Saprospiraceae bacterium]